MTNSNPIILDRKQQQTTLRVVIQEYTKSTRSYRGRKAYRVRLGSSSQVKPFLERFETMLKSMDTEGD